MFFLDLCQALQQAKIHYAIVGGYAVALHGAVRGTLDIDLVLALDERCYIKAERIFEKMGLKSRLPVTGQQVFRFREEYIQSRNLVAWSFYNPHKPSYQLDVIITGDARDLDIETHNISGIKVRVASIKSLIQMKEQSARPQDLEDIKALRSLLKSEK